ncbi:unnamed protein product [Closterium sp. NIES-65]|nr:unnamed protein product [Closterium sp. NIES-65]
MSRRMGEGAYGPAAGPSRVGAREASGGVGAGGAGEGRGGGVGEQGGARLGRGSGLGGAGAAGLDESKKRKLGGGSGMAGGSGVPERGGTGGSSTHVRVKEEPGEHVGAVVGVERHDRTGREHGERRHEGLERERSGLGVERRGAGHANRGEERPDSGLRRGGERHDNAGTGAGVERRDSRVGVSGGAMAENEWLSGYLDAILERGGAPMDTDKKERLDLSEIKGQSGTAVRYFVNEIKDSSEEELHRTWMKPVFFYAPQSSPFYTSQYPKPPHLQTFPNSPPTMPEIYNDLCLPWRFLPQLEQEASRIEEEQQQHDKEEAELDIEEEEDTPDSTLPDSLSLLHEDRANTDSYSPHSLQEHVLLKFLFLRDLLPPVQLEQEASRIKEQQQHDKEEAELDIEEEDGPDDDALPDALSGADVAADVDKAGDDLLDSSANVAAAQAAAAKAAAEKESRGRRENQQQGERQREVPAGAGLTAEAPGRDPLEHGTEKRLYIVMISIHGLVRGENMELGRDSDTGGQVKYVVEIARALASMPQVYRVDLLTRQIVAPGVDWSYGEPSEMLSSLRYDPDGLIAGESVGAYIIRLPCGPRDQYLRKEALWPYVDEFVDGALTHIMHMSRELADQIGDGQRVWPYMIHGHYADAGDIAALLSGALNVPMVLTGHSLGRNKLEQLLKQGRMSRAEINTQYAIDRRIEAEEFSLDAAELVVTSTRQEVEEQWGLYDGFDVRLERVLRARQLRGVSCHGRFMPRMAVIPPGMDFSNVVVPDIDGSDSPGPEPPIWAEVRKFWSNPHKPIILALARPDPKKNLTTLVRAFGESQALRDLANLCLVMGNRDDIDAMSAGNAEVLTTVLKLIDKYDLYGQVAYPKHHKQAEVPDIYALAAKSKGVFVNPALVEPFGLTLIEAAAHGLPMVATKNGGPVDIQKMLSNGLVVDPHDANALSSALLQLVADRALWTDCRKSALANIHKYSWPQHCASLLTRVAQSRLRHPVWRAAALFDQVAAATSSTHPSTGLHSESLRDIQDLSLRLSFDGKFWGGGSFQGGSMDLSFMLDNLGVIRPDGRSASGYAAEPSHAAAGGFGGSGGLGGGEGLGEGAALGIHNRLGNYSFTGGMGSESVGRYREGVGGSGRLQGMQEEGEDGGAGGAGAGEKGSAAGAAAAAAFEGLRLRRRRRLIVVAVDEYDPVGRPGSSVLDSLCAALEVAYRHNTGTLRERVVWGMGPGGEIGVVLATALTARETVAMLTAAGVGLRQLDALIAGGGSEVYYSVPCSTASELGAAAAGGTGAGAGAGEAAGMAAGLVSAMAPLEDREGWQLLPDPDYFAHIEYRWSADGVRRSMGRILAHAIKGTASGGAASAATPPVAGCGGVFPPPAAALSAAAAAAGNGAAAAVGNGAATNEEEYVRSISFSDGLTAIASEPAAPSTRSGIPGSKSVTGSRIGGAGAGSRGARGNGLLLQQQQLLAVQRVCVEDEMRTTSRRLAYRVLDVAQMPTAAELRRRLRLRGLRCHVGYCRAATCLHILPLHASRSQALRYLCVRWGLEPADLAVVVGSPAGADGDYAQLLSGMHHTLILEPPPADVAQHQGAAAAAAAGMDPFAEYRRKLLHEFVPRSDVHLPNLVNVEDSSSDKVGALAGALEKIGFA